MKTVEPIKDIEMIGHVRERLETLGAPLYAHIFTMGINTALRISDLLAIRFSDISSARGVRTLRGVSQKTGKTFTLALNAAAVDIVDARRALVPNDVYLFQSHDARLGDRIQPVSRQSVSTVFRNVGECESVGIALGTHSMRKTRGYHLYVSSNHNIGLVQKVLMHSNSSHTLRYIGVDNDTVDASFRDFVL